MLVVMAGFDYSVPTLKTFKPSSDGNKMDYFNSKTVIGTFYVDFWLSDMGFNKSSYISRWPSRNNFLLVLTRSNDFRRVFKI